MEPQGSVGPFLRTGKFSWVLFCALLCQDIAATVECFLGSVLCALTPLGV